MAGKKKSKRGVDSKKDLPSTNSKHQGFDFKDPATYTEEVKSVSTVATESTKPTKSLSLALGSDSNSKTVLGVDSDSWEDMTTSEEDNSEDEAEEDDESHPIYGPAKDDKGFNSVLKACVGITATAIDLQNTMDVDSDDDGYGLHIVKNRDNSSFDSIMKLTRVFGADNYTLMFPDEKSKLLKIEARDNITSMCASYIRAHIVGTRIGESKFSVVLADDTRDQSNSWQLSLSLRYLYKGPDVKRPVVEERLLRYFQHSSYKIATCGGCPAAFSGAITEALEDEYGLDMSKCLSFSYNGRYGLADRVYRILDNIQAMDYPHVSLEHDYKMVCLSKAVFGAFNDGPMYRLWYFMSKIHRFFKKRAPMMLSLRTVISGNLQKEPEMESRLLNAIKTNWADRHNGLEITMELLPHIKEVLEQLERKKEEKYVKQWCLYEGRKLCDWIDDDLIASLTASHVIMSTLYTLSLKLQGKPSEMATASMDLTAAIQRLKVYKANVDDLQHEIWAKTLELGLKLNMTLRLRTPSAKEEPKYYSKLVARAKRGTSITEEYYKNVVTIPIIDEVLNHLKKRFPSADKFEIMRIMPSALLSRRFRHKSGEETWHERILEATVPYHKHLIKPARLAAELRKWYAHWSEWASKDRMIPVPDDTLRCYRAALRLKLPNITSLLEVLCVLPIVSECSVKRTLYDIPHPKKGKAHRIHMPLDRLNSHAVLCANRDMMSCIDEDEVYRDYYDEW